MISKAVGAERSRYWGCQYASRLLLQARCRNQLFMIQVSMDMLGLGSRHSGELCMLVRVGFCGVEANSKQQYQQQLLHRIGMAEHKLMKRSHCSATVSIVCLSGRFPMPSATASPTVGERAMQQAVPVASIVPLGVEPSNHEPCQSSVKCWPAWRILSACQSKPERLQKSEPACHPQ